MTSEKNTTRRDFYSFVDRIVFEITEKNQVSAAIMCEKVG